MTTNQTMIAGILSLSARLDDMVRRGNLVLRFPTSRTSDSTLGALQQNPRAVDYIIQDEAPEHRGGI